MKQKPFLALAGLSFSLTLAAAEARVDPRIFAGKEAGERASFLVVMREQADVSGAEAFAEKAEKGRFVYEALTAQAEASQAPLRARLESAGVAFRSFYLVNMIEVEGDRALARDLAAREDVAAVAPNLRFAPVPAPPEPRLFEARPLEPAGVEPNIEMIRAPEVWARGYTGQGIVIGIADTGVVWNHSALRTHYRGFDGVKVSHDYNWHDAVHDAGATNVCGSSAPIPCDDQGHGTSTTSLAVGDDGAGNRVGVAPGARFIACRNMDRGDGTPARYTECFQFFLAPTDGNGANPRPDLAAHVISNSWGCPESEGCTDPNVLKAVVENVRAAGILVVVAAGNEGPKCLTVGVPALYEASLAVGATTSTDTIASFSSRGPVLADGSDRLKPDICAPGVGLRVAARAGGFSGGFSGTSASTPEVSGAVALIWSALPGLVGHPPATEVLLKRTAVPLLSAQDCIFNAGNVVPNAVYGYGRIDVAAALGIHPRPTPSLPSNQHETRVVPPR